MCGTRAYAGLRNCPTVYLAGATASEKVELCQQRTLLMAFCTVVLLPFALENVTEKKCINYGVDLFSMLSFSLRFLLASIVLDRLKLLLSAYTQRVKTGNSLEYWMSFFDLFCSLEMKL